MGERRERYLVASPERALPLFGREPDTDELIEWLAAVVGHIDRDQIEVALESIVTSKALSGSRPTRHNIYFCEIRRSA